VITIVIPARLESTRLERKALAQIGDYPMLWWTWQNAKQSKYAKKVVIATDSKEILDSMTGYGAECIMTPTDCQSGSDRVFQAIKQIPESEIIVNLQGDEPLMKLEMLDGTIQTFIEKYKGNNLNTIGGITTAVTPFHSPSDYENPNNVKCVFNGEGKALYFSRATLAEAWLHLGLYVFQRQALESFCSAQPSLLEKAEKLEQLRAFELDIPIFVYKAESVNKDHFGVDTAEDLERAKRILLG
jgi:3-deoxy-manno-octulosonate cytidylyltransferase (CMP-KDO synthetase)